MNFKNLLLYGILSLSALTAPNLHANNSITNFHKVHVVEQQDYSIYSVDKVKQFFKQKNKVVLTFVGYSGKGYENENLMLLQAEDYLKNFSPKQTIVNIGVTPDGIGAVYKLAKSLGFETSGVVSKNAKPYLDSVSDVDHVFLIDDETWGGYNDDGTLNPTSQAMVDASHVMIGIGGGDVGYAELFEAIQSNKVVFFQRAEMNRNKAISKAQKKGKPTPTSFFGKSNEIHKVLFGD